MTDSSIPVATKARRTRWAAAPLSLLLVATMLAFGGGVTASGAATVTPKPKVCPQGFCYYFVTMRVSDAVATGATVRLSQPRPLVAKDERSEAAIAVNSTNGKQGIEFGWIVSKEVFKDTQPHLAVRALVDGVATCLDACGFVQAPKQKLAGSGVTVGQIGTYTIKLGKLRWNLIYDGRVIGYYPTSLWKNNGLARARVVRAYGAVGSPSDTTPMSEMGNGRYGTSLKSAKIIGLKLTGVTGVPTYSYSNVDAPTKYKIGFVNLKCKTACTMNYGGPGF